MLPLQNTRVQPLVLPVAITNNAAFTSQAVDTFNSTAGTKFENALVMIRLGALDIALTALKVQHCDTSGGTYADITGADFSVSPATLPSATDDNNLFLVDINLSGKKRFLKVVATMGNGSTGGFLTGECILCGAGQSPNTATERGASQLIQIA